MTPKRVPDDGTDDGCLRCCVAVMLDMHPKRVPHFVRRHGARWELHLARWLAKRGAKLVRYENPPLYIAIGKKRSNGESHAVVSKAGKTVYDSNRKRSPFKRVLRSYIIVTKAKSARKRAPRRTRPSYPR